MVPFLTLKTPGPIPRPKGDPVCGSRLGELRSGLSRNGIDAELSLFHLECKLKAFLQEALHHPTGLPVVADALVVRLAGDVLNLEYGLSATLNLLGVELIGELNEVGHRIVERGDDTIGTQRIPFPGVPGLLGLMVATSNAGVASAAIDLGRRGGSGIAHAVSGVARVKFSGAGPGP
jgi:hypothetical protein